MEKGRERNVIKNDPCFGEASLRQGKRILLLILITLRKHQTLFSVKCGSNKKMTKEIRYRARKRCMVEKMMQTIGRQVTI